ncbi:MAG: hypothetical protein JXA46_15335 [Dehalococcoidales bacterium]|nr:hypothetical protein [Dehalococcoidales bacterium]
MKGGYYTFIVRIHSESGGKFVGHIQHLHTQEEAHFETFKDMKAFMVKHLGLPKNVISGKNRRIDPGQG